MAQEHSTLHVMDDQSRIALVRVGDAIPRRRRPGGAVPPRRPPRQQRVIVDADGDVDQPRGVSTPYGETSFGSYARKRYRFTGKERDEESGLSYHGARYYAPWLGRWASAIRHHLLMA